jgi:DDE domain
MPRNGDIITLPVDGRLITARVGAPSENPEVVKAVDYEARELVAWRKHEETNRRGDFPVQSFDCLGYAFRPRQAVWHGSRYGTFFLPAASPKALKAIRQTIRRWALQHRTVWRAVDHTGIAAAAQAAEKARPPRVTITDKLGSYRAAKREVMPGIEHRQHKGLNNRSENSHQPTRRREPPNEAVQISRPGAALPISPRSDQ